MKTRGIYFIFLFSLFASRVLFANSVPSTAQSSIKISSVDELNAQLVFTPNPTDYAFATAGMDTDFVLPESMVIDLPNSWTDKMHQSLIGKEQLGQWAFTVNPFLVLERRTETPYALGLAITSHSTISLVHKSFLDNETDQEILKPNQHFIWTTFQTRPAKPSFQVIRLGQRLEQKPQITQFHVISKDLYALGLDRFVPKNIAPSIFNTHLIQIFSSPTNTALPPSPWYGFHDRAEFPEDHDENLFSIVDAPKPFTAIGELHKPLPPPHPTEQSAARPFGF